MTEPEDTRCAVCERPQHDCDCDAEGAALDREIVWSWDDVVTTLEAELADTERRLDALQRAVLDAVVLRATCAEGRLAHLREQEWDRIVALAGER